MNMALKYENLKEGQEVQKLVKAPINKVQLARYAGASGDFNPIHLDEDFARRAGMDGVITQGMLNMGFLAQYASELAGDNADLVRLKVRFVAVSRPGDVITCTAKVAKLWKEEGAQYATLDIKGEKAPGQAVTTGEVVLRFR